jgi:hypothetical protein
MKTDSNVNCLFVVGLFFCRWFTVNYKLCPCDSALKTDIPRFLIGCIAYGD